MRLATPQSHSGPHSPPCDPRAGTAPLGHTPPAEGCLPIASGLAASPADLNCDAAGPGVKKDGIGRLQSPERPAHSCGLSVELPAPPNTDGGGVGYFHLLHQGRVHLQQRHGLRNLTVFLSSPGRLQASPGLLNACQIDHLAHCSVLQVRRPVRSQPCT